MGKARIAREKANAAGRYGGVNNDEVVTILKNLQAIPKPKRQKSESVGKNQTNSWNKYMAWLLDEFLYGIEPDGTKINTFAHSAWQNVTGSPLPTRHEYVF